MNRYALVVGERPNARTENLLLTVRCPFCKKKHGHGSPAGDRTLGTRVADCGGGVYTLTRSPAVVALCSKPAEDMSTAELKLVAAAIIAELAGDEVASS